MADGMISTVISPNHLSAKLLLVGKSYTHLQLSIATLLCEANCIQKPSRNETHGWHDIAQDTVDNKLEKT